LIHGITGYNQKYDTSYQLGSYYVSTITITTAIISNSSIVSITAVYNIISTITIASIISNISIISITAVYNIISTITASTTAIISNIKIISISTVYSADNLNISELSP
jgi:hypothetical protein